MRTIYKHQGHKEFNPELLAKGIAERWGEGFGEWNKVEAALWCSPYNQPNTMTWEDFYTGDYNDVSRSLLKDFSDIHPISCCFEDWNDFVFWNNVVSSMQYSDKISSNDSFLQSYKDEHELTIEQLREEMTKLYEHLQPVLYGYLKETCRDNAFYFVVDESKVLSAHVPADLDEYLIKKEGYFREFVDFDKIRNDGYAALELCSRGNFRNATFNMWDCASMSIWDGDIVTVIDREIANISRLANDAHIVHQYGRDSVFTVDQADDHMNPEYLYQWMQDNQEKVVDAVQMDIISQEDIQKFVNMVVEERATRSQINEVQYIAEPSEIEQEEFGPTLE